jgi:hypothetical protein
MANTKWPDPIPCEQRLPPVIDEIDGTSDFVLAFTINEERWCEAWFDHRNSLWRFIENNERNARFGVSHWLPLPPDPPERRAPARSER